MSEPAAPPLESAHARKEIDSVYTPLAEAVEELHRRRSDAKLRATVAEFERALPPYFAPAEPFAALSRYIVTPTHEVDRFVAIVRETGLRPLLLEYPQDRFLARNRDKYRLCRPAFTVRCGQVRSLKIVDFGQREGHRLDELTVSNGAGLVSWHHVLLEHAHPDCGAGIVDFSKWFSQSTNGNSYYLRYLALFVRCGILFENFMVHDLSELRFARERVLPSFAKATEMFGVRPLIVSLLPRETEHEEHWRCHRGELYAKAMELMRRKA